MSIIRNKDMASTHGFRIKKSMKENGWMESSMDSDTKQMKEMWPRKVNGKMVKELDGLMNDIQVVYQMLYRLSSLLFLPLYLPPIFLLSSTFILLNVSFLIILRF